MKLNLLQKNSVPEEIIAAANGDLTVSRILYGRGYDTEQKIKDFFLKDYIPVQTADIPDIEKAVERINCAIEKKEQICVYGDYDVDGVTSTVILVECLQELEAEVIYHVPDRFSEGYGMNKEVIESIASQGVKLIVTCDCGIANIDEIELANQLGMEVIITDHHTPPQILPQAFCLINPKLWGDSHKAYNVSGAVVAFYLIRALFENHGITEKSEQYLELLALSIVADVIRLDSENRYLLSKGLENININTRIGLKELIEIGNKTGASIDEDFLGFQIAPRINAAGRLNTARKAVDLLMAREKYEARRLAQEINTLNITRKEIESGIVKIAEEYILSTHKNKSIIIVYNENWHLGVIGIAAGRICEKYNKPTILLTSNEDREIAVGSARAPEGISIYDILRQCEQYLIKFGGHSAAAGLSLKVVELKTFIKKAEAIADQYIIDDTKIVNIDLELEIKDIDDAFVNSVHKLSPFGEGFPQPIFFSKGVFVESNLPIRDIGRRMIISAEERKISAVYWNDASFNIVDKKIDIIFSLKESVFRGNRETKMTIQYVTENGSLTRVTTPSLITLTDLRETQEYTPQPEDLIFYEGIDKPFNFKTYNRYEILSTKRLVLYSTPSNLNIFKDIVAKSMPEELVLVFKDENEQMGSLLNRAMGVIKHIMHFRYGKTSNEELTGILGLSNEIVDVLLRILYFSGIIKYDDMYGDLIILEGNGIKQPEAKRYQRVFVNQLNEMNSFRKFIKTIRKEEISKYLSIESLVV